MQEAKSEFNVFSVVSSGKGDKMIVSISSGGESVSFDMTEDQLIKIHKKVFVETLDKRNEKSNNFKRLADKCKQRILPDSFPNLPKKPIRYDEVTTESFARKVEDYLNHVFREFTDLFNETLLYSILDIPQNVQIFIRNLVFDASQRHLEFLFSHPEYNKIDLPEDPHRLFSNIGWLMEAEKEIRGEIPVYQDKTEIFEHYLDEWREKQWIIPSDIKEKYILLFVPGLYTGVYNRIVGYLEANIKPFLKSGISAMKIDEINTFSSIHTNCIIIERKIREIIETPEHKDKKIVLIGHSKGGIDSLSMLSLKGNEWLSNVVAGVICLQSPFAGSPFAKKIGFLRSLKGTRAMNDLNHVERRSFLESHPLNVVERGVKIICLVSELDSPAGAFWGNIKRLQAHTEFSCDGLVVPIDGIIPDSQAVILKDIDHNGLTFKRLRFGNTNNRYLPGPLTVCAFRLFLEGK